MAHTPLTLKRHGRFMKTAGTTTLAAALVLGSAATAHAAPTPYEGPVQGGTTVTIAAPTFKFSQVSANIGAFSTALGSYTGLSECVIPNSGQAFAWGYNASGELGNGTNSSSNVPVPVQQPAGVTFTQVTAGDANMLAIGDDGNTYAWSVNLGNGTNSSSNVPVVVQQPAGVTFTQLAAGESHALAIGDDGKTYAWGGNSSGVLGDGTNTDSNVPVVVQQPAGVTFTQVNAGDFFSVAIGSDGNTYAWGENWDGTLGNGTNTNSNVPVVVQQPAGVTFTQVNAGDSHVLAIGDDGNTYAWGGNYVGELGDGTNSSSNVPVLVQQPAGVSFTQLVGGDFYSVALGSDDNVYAWGANDGGQLGDGTNTDSNVPVQVVNPPAAVVTGITFDGVAGTSLVDNGDGTVSVVAPAHDAGPVDVVLSWTLNGVTQDPMTCADGFAYFTLTITDPSDQTVSNGETATFNVSVSNGGPTHTVTWEVSTDGGVSWQPITADPAATPSADGLTLSVVGSSTNNGNLYRATASNGVNPDVVSAPALLTVTQPAGPGTGNGGNATTNQQNLPNLGGTSVPLWAGLIPLIAGLGLIMANRIAKRRTA